MYIIVYIQKTIPTDDVFATNNYKIHIWSRT